MTGTIPHPYSEEMAVDWIQSLQAGEEGVAFAIDRSGALIGCVGYRATERTHAEMGYWIGRQHWGKGFATEASRALIEIAKALKLPRLEASHFLDNPASGRVLEKLGFVATGMSAERYSCARGGEAMAKIYRLRLIEREEAMAA
jgi:RimJ/RimL family protein N-acetyltransferase